MKWLECLGYIFFKTWKMQDNTTLESSKICPFWKQPIQVQKWLVDQHCYLEIFGLTMGLWCPFQGILPIYCCALPFTCKHLAKIFAYGVQFRTSLLISLETFGVTFGLWCSIQDILSIYRGALFLTWKHLAWFFSNWCPFLPIPPIYLSSSS